MTNSNTRNEHPDGNCTSEDLSPAEVSRYARHFSLPEVGPEGQRKLKRGSVLCIGAGGLGSPVTMYLAAAGVGRIGLVDADVVDETNLQRQILHGASDVGKPKLASAEATLQEINPHVALDLHETTFTAANAREIAAGYDVVIDGTDNFATRYLSNDVCYFLKIPNVYGSILRFEGQCSVFAPHLGGPCYRCMFPEPPDPGSVPSCAEGGVLGVLPGIVGSLQALEAIKLILGVGDPLIGRLVHFDALKFNFREFRLRRDTRCPLCGDDPQIEDLIDYDQFCNRPRGGPSPSAGTGDEAGTVPAVTVHELAGMRDQGMPFTLLDVRQPFEEAICRIEGAQLIPLGELRERWQELDRESDLLVYCKTGIRSGKAVAFLRGQGFSKARNVTGGIRAWGDAFDPDMPRY